ncbi:MAG TPA: ferritin-like domain-containing protein [Candidatus Binatia bacterium]|nr:ferritin-like domain-containing protein [Candidatus Binatia bacterium]
MSLTHSVCTGWQQFLDALIPNDRQKLLVWLSDEYQEEAQDVAQFTQHAERMYYPQFRERLRRIAAEEETHVQWLREQILALGGQPPAVARTPKAGQNTWQNLLLDFDEEKQSCATLLEGMRVATPVDAEIVAGLQRLREEEIRHHEEIRDMLMKSEPDAVPPPEPLAHESAKQKQMWLEQQKMAWLAQRRAEWEAAGKPVPWVEWEREQELKWVTELPNYELQWVRHLAASARTEPRKT